MRRAIREHLRDFVAVIALLFAGLLVTGYILSQQQQPYPSWIPFLGDDRFELQGRALDGAGRDPRAGPDGEHLGVKAGDISEVDLVDGDAVVTMLIEQQYSSLIHPNATVLLRPRDRPPGHDRRTGSRHRDGVDRRRVNDPARANRAQREPRPDPGLAGRRHARLPPAAASRRPAMASAAAASDCPRACADSSPSAATSRRSIGCSRSGGPTSRARSPASAQLSEALGRSDTRLAEWVTAQNRALAGFAAQSEALQEACASSRRLCRATQAGLDSSARLSQGPRAGGHRPDPDGTDLRSGTDGRFRRS